MLQHVHWGSNNIESGAWVNNGDGWEEASAKHIPPVEIANNHGNNNSRGIDNSASFIDITGSGLYDMVQNVYWGAGSSKKGAWINTGDGWIEAPVSYIPPVELVDHSSPRGSDNGVVFIDLTGSGLPDIIQHVQWSLTRDFQKGAWFNKAKKLPDYLISVTDGFGTKLFIDYESLSSTKVKVYTKEHDAKYPNMDWQGPMYVVHETSSETASNEAGNKNNQHITNYYYIGAKFNHLGMGFLGFHRVTSVDKSTGINTTTTYSQDINLHNKGMPVATETRLADGTLLSSSEDSYELKTFGDGSVNTTYYFPYVKQSSKKSYDLKGNLLSTTTIENIFDDYANSLKIVSSIHEATTNEIYTITTENTYHNDPSKWHIGELIAAKVTKSATHRDSQTRTSSFVYDPETSLLMQTTAGSGDSKLALITKYERDDFGNIIKTMVWGRDQDVGIRSAQVKYDQYGCFVVQTINSLDQSTYQTVDPRFGVVTESVDLNGVKTTYQYDDFARQVGQISPDGTKTTINYSCFDPTSVPTGEISSALKNCSYIITSHTDNSTTQNEYFDVLGRKIASTTQNIDGKIIWQLTYYDELGRVSQTSQPFFEGDHIYQNKIQYDILGKVIQSVLPDGSSSQLIYDRFTTTTVNQLKQKQVKQVNAIGEMIKATDNKGSVTTYKYGAYGNMISMIDSAENESKIEYDHLGRKIAINDPDKGYWTYEYDVLGNLISQTDALKQTTTFKYDDLNRMISRTDHAGTSTWEYDTTPNGIGKLAKVNSVNLAGKSLREKLELPKKAIDDGLETYTRSYSYDSLGRTTQVKTAIKDETYISSSSYDQNSRVAVETYPNGLQVRNHYNKLGYLIKISDEQTGKVYWSLNAKDAAGHVISESRSNGLITNYTYDPKTQFLTEIETVLSMSLLAQQKLFPECTGVTATHQCFDKEKIQKDAYDYDTLGNVKSHHDYVNGGYEQYEYDELNRLAKAKIAGSSEQSFSYDALGNITYKSDVGTYKYGENGAGPHAVTSINGKMPGAFKYDANGDQIEGILNGEKRNITYTSYSKPLTITAPKAAVSFSYNADRQKFARVDYMNQTAGDCRFDWWNKCVKYKVATTYYLGNYELVTIDNGKSIITQQKAYIGPSAIYIETQDSGDSKNNKTEIYEALHDNLGSVTDITDENSSVKQHFAYLPFGEQKQTKGDKPYHPVTYKGFTGHDQIDIEGINLIHMDGRIYDPVIGRFLSADPFIQEPGNSQSLNRYSYCINNPLAFTDPTGFGFWGSLGRSIVGAVKSVVNSTVGRIAVGVVVAVVIGITICLCPPVGLSLGGIALAAAIGGATTAGLGLAAGVGWKQAFFEGAATFAISAGVLYAGASCAGKLITSGGTAISASASGSGTGVAFASLGIGIPLKFPGDGIRAPQGDGFPDQTFHRNSNNADSSGDNNHFQNEKPRKESDRSDGSYGNGAGTEAYWELFDTAGKVAQDVAAGSILGGSAGAIIGGEIGFAGGTLVLPGVGTFSGYAAGATFGLVAGGAVGAGAALARDLSVMFNTPSRAKAKHVKEQGPREIKRIDEPPRGQPSGQWHAHGKNGGAVNQDGSISHGKDPGFSGKTLDWLRDHGWKI